MPAARQTSIHVKPATRTPVAVVTIVTLGRLGLDGPVDAKAARLLTQPKRLAVLLYLLLSQRGGAQSRDGVVGLFWPESDSVRARNALRQTLSFIRSCLGESAVVGIGSHGLAVTGLLACDATRFEELLDEERNEEALLMYRGELLPGFHVEGSIAFTHWLDARRQHLSARAAKAAWDLSASYEARAKHQGAAFWGKRALSLSPFSESEVLRLLRLLDRVGDFAGALRAFQGLKGTLHAEFGAKPSAEITQLAAEIERRLHDAGLHTPALLEPRRGSSDRRLTERRIEQTKLLRSERRSQRDRRTGHRRSGFDRRDIRT